MDIRRLRRILQRERVEEAAACARALAALVGREVQQELLSGGTAEITRAALTGRMITAQLPAPWPNAIMRQCNPDDPSFLPALGVHPVLSARDCALLGLPGRGGAAWIDPLGWCGTREGPSVAVWFACGREAWPVGRRPGDFHDRDFTVSQRRTDDGFGIETCCVRGDLTLQLMHWSVLLEGRLSWAVQAKLTYAGQAPRPARLGFAVRPACREGAAPIFHISRSREGIWSADGTPLLALSRPGDEVMLGRRGEDPWQRFSGRVFDRPTLRTGAHELRCASGMASGLECYRMTLTPGEPFSRLAVISPAPKAIGALIRTSAAALWHGAQADHLGGMAAGAQLVIARHQLLLDACRMRLLLAPAQPGLASFVGAVALARLGFVRRAGTRIGRWLSKIGRDGSFRSAQPDDAAVLAWSAVEYVRWTGQEGWLSEHLPALTRLLDRLCEAPCTPGGTALITPEGSRRWTRIWKSIALLTSARVLREHTKRHQRWAIEGSAERESLSAALGSEPWSISSDRPSDATAAGLLTACWFGLISSDHPGALATARHLRSRHWHGGGVLHRSGAHIAATALVAAVLARQDPSIDPLDMIAKLASEAGNLPTARHPIRGALGDGDDALSAAMFVLLALDQIRAERGVLTILPGILSATGLPTPLGWIDITRDENTGAASITGRWRGAPPQIVTPHQ